MDYKVLIIEDDSIISTVLKKMFIQWGIGAKSITDFKDILKSFTEYSPHLVLMDISLPFFNGYYWCREIRRVSKVPIIFISSASDNINIVMAMNMGADDFITKPFDLDVLNAKVQAHLRRAYEFSINHNVIQRDGVILDTSNGTVSFNGNTTELTKNEFKILQVLLESHGKIVHRDTLMERLWETDSFVDDNTLTVNVNRLRKTLSEIGLSDYILTKKGLGYMIS